MKTTCFKKFLFLGMFIFFIDKFYAFSQQSLNKENIQSPASEIILATIDVASGGAPVHPYTYGMFTELLGNIFEHGLWAEMISDRKFFYPVDTTKKLNPANTRRFQNRWRPMESVDAVEMDMENPFTGEHTPKIMLMGDKPLGMQQSGLSFKKGKEYAGYVILSGSEKASILISIVWGSGQEGHYSIIINSPPSGYKKFPFKFTAGSDTDQGRIEITGTGEGYFKVGAVSLMPADNMKGYRADLISLLKELKSGIYRWPGGNMLAGYDWRDGIGDRDKRPPRYDYAWNAVEPNDVGTDEYLDLCELLDIDPYICVNIGFGDDHSAAQWVEYVNGPANSTMGKLRAQNGHPEPYNVEWWGIGNEMYGQWQLGHMAIEHYILKHNMFAKAMLKVDPGIKIIASGATPFETSTTARHHRPPLPDRLPYKFGSREDWSYQLLAHASDNIHFLAEHLYPETTRAFDVDSQKFVEVNDPLVDQVRRVPNRIKAIAESWEEYTQRIPELKDKNITFAVDEWTGGGWRSGFVRTLCAAAGLHEMFRHSDIITMGGYTAVTSCVEFNAKDACLSSVGLVFKLYRHHFGTLPLEVTGNSPQKQVKGTVGVDKPAESSGSPTWPLDVMAALDEGRKILTVAVINPTETIQEMQLNFKGASPEKGLKQYIIVAPSIEARNIAGSDPAIKIEETALKSLPKKFEVPPLSISVYEFTLKK
ncbi:MAG: hypothetical protein JXB00_19530 [Bacteroidales bacterium]|nr:hypothetical protein [Bacteroidales bacterium]